MQVQTCIAVSLITNSVVSWSFHRSGLENKSNLVTDRTGHAKTADISQLIPVKAAFSTSSLTCGAASREEKAGVPPA